VWRPGRALCSTRSEATAAPHLEQLAVLGRQLGRCRCRGAARARARASPTCAICWQLAGKPGGGGLGAVGRYWVERFIGKL
jgi:hypothetical protein